SSLTLLSSLALAACGRAPQQGAGTASSSDITPHRGGTMVTGWTAEPASVNDLIVPSTSVSQEMQVQLFLRLVEEQADFQEHPPTVKPLLAKSYEWSADHKDLTFHLREDVVWSDGVPVT